MKDLAPVDVIEKKIIVVRDEKVMIDADLAALYGVATKVLNQAVKRNRARFPEDFTFQLTKEEKQKVVTNCDHLRLLLRELNEIIRLNKSNLYVTIEVKDGRP